MDDLWDDSTIIPRSPARQQASSSLFLASPSKSPEKAATRAAEKGASKSNATSAHLKEIEELFADVDDLDDAPPAKKTRRSEAGGKAKSGRPSAVNVLLSDEDDEDNEDPASKAANAAKDADDDDDSKKKPRKKPVKLDENRLLGKTGFPALVEQHRKFKPSGKGNEAKDLKRLLQMYQFWAVKMYPRSDFRETAEKVEKLCHSKRMHNALSSYKTDLEYANGGGPQVVVDVEDDPDEAANSDSAPKSKATPINAPRFGSGATSDDEDETPLQYPSSRPSTSMSHNGAATDLDDILAADLAERQAAQARERERRQTAETAPAKTKAAASAPMDDDWDLDALLAEEEEAQTLLTSAPKAGGSSQPESDFGVEIDVDMDFEFQPPPVTGASSSSKALSSTTKKTPPLPSPPEEDEEMWDMIGTMHDE